MSWHTRSSKLIQTNMLYSNQNSTISNSSSNNHLFPQTLGSKTNLNYDDAAEIMSTQKSQPALLLPSISACREGESKRRNLLETNPMEELHSFRQHDDPSYLFLKSDTLDSNRTQLDPKEQLTKGQSKQHSQKQMLFQSNQLQQSAQIGNSMHSKSSFLLFPHDDILPIPTTIDPHPSQQMNNYLAAQNQITFEHSQQADTIITVSNLNKPSGANVSFQSTPPHQLNQLSVVQQPQILSNQQLSLHQQSSRRASTKPQQERNIFAHLNFIKRFVMNMKSASRKYIFRHLQEHQFQILDDLSSDYKFYQQEGYIDKQLMTFREQISMSFLSMWNGFLDQPSFVITPESMLIQIWEAVSMVVFLILIFLIPINTNFKPEFLSDFSFMHKLPLYVIPFEMVLKLNTAVYKRGMLMENRREIFRKFLKSDAKLDLLMFLAYLLSQMDGLSVLEYSITLKMGEIVDQMKRVFRKVDSEMRNQVSLKVIILIFVILTFSHTQATIFVRIGLWEIDNNHNSWISLLGDSASSTEIYISSLYWSMITMVTIGYGDIHPVTEIEMIYVSVISLVSCGIYGYSFNQIGQIVDQYEKESELFNNQIQILNRHMSQRSLSKKIQHQVLKYFEYLHKDDQVNDDQANAMLENLPGSMKTQIIRDINYRVLSAQKAFALNFSATFLESLALEMKQIKLGPEIDLYNQPDADDRVYFILKGQVEMYINLGSIQKTGYILKKGQMFGDIEFLCQQQRMKCAKTLNVVQLLFINYKDFLRVIAQFPNDFEIYSMMKDRARLYNNLIGLDRRCSSCKKFNHQYIECPQLQYTPNMHMLIAKNNKSEFQARMKYSMRSTRKYRAHALNDHNEFLQSFNRFLNGLEEEALNPTGVSPVDLDDAARGDGQEEEQVEENQFMNKRDDQDDINNIHNIHNNTIYFDSKQQPDDLTTSNNNFNSFTPAAALLNNGKSNFQMEAIAAATAPIRSQTQTFLQTTPTHSAVPAIPPSVPPIPGMSNSEMNTLQLQPTSLNNNNTNPGMNNHSNPNNYQSTFTPLRGGRTNTIEGDFSKAQQQQQQPQQQQSHVKGSVNHRRQHDNYTTGAHNTMQSIPFDEMDGFMQKAHPLFLDAASSVKMHTRDAISLVSSNNNQMMSQKKMQAGRLRTYSIDESSRIGFNSSSNNNKDNPQIKDSNNNNNNNVMHVNSNSNNNTNTIAVQDLDYMRSMSGQKSVNQYNENEFGVENIRVGGHAMYVHSNPLEVMHTYRIYFPYNNIGNVLKSYQKFAKQTSQGQQNLKLIRKKKFQMTRI